MNEDRGGAGSFTSGATGLTPIDKLELKIRVLEQEIPFFSNKAAEAMVQGQEDNTFKMETEKRLEELTKAKEELKKLTAEKRSSAQDGAAAKPPQATPPASSPPATYAQGMGRPMQRMPSSQMSGPGGQQQQPNMTRKQYAMVLAENRVKHAGGPQDAPALCSLFLDYSDLVTAACVNKLWRSRFRKSPGWRRVVLNLETTLNGHVGRISALTTFDSYVVTGSTDGKIKFWDPSKNFVCVKTLNITPSPVHKYVHPRLRELREQRMASGHVPTEEEEFAEYPLAVTSLLAVDRCLLIGAEDGRFIVWMASMPEKKEFDTVVHTRALNCIVVGWDEFIFTASLDGKVAAILRKGFPFNPQAPAVWQAPHYGMKRHESGVVALAVAGSYLFSGAMDGKIFVWNPRGMEFRRTLTHPRAMGANGVPVTIEHTDRITSMIGVSDRLYTASWDGTIKLWNARSLECVRDVPVLPIGICWSLAIRRDPLSRMTTLVGGVRDSDICVMDWETLEILSSSEENNWAYKLDRHTHWVKCILAAHDGRIISGSDDWTAKVWQIRGSAQRPQGLFVGLPPGQLSQEDLEIILSQMQKRAGQHITAEQLQEQKLHYDKSLKEKLATMTPEQIAQHEQFQNKAMEGWTKARERLRKDRGGATSTAAATPGGVADASNTSILGASATPGALPATPAATLNPSGSPDAEAMKSSAGENGLPTSSADGADKAAEPAQPNGANGDEHSKPEAGEGSPVKTDDVQMENREASAETSAATGEAVPEENGETEKPDAGDEVVKGSDESGANPEDEKKDKEDVTEDDKAGESAPDVNAESSAPETTGVANEEPAPANGDEPKPEENGEDGEDDGESEDGSKSGGSGANEREPKRRKIK